MLVLLPSLQWFRVKSRPPRRVMSLAMLVVLVRESGARSWASEIIWQVEIDGRASLELVISLYLMLGGIVDCLMMSPDLTAESLKGTSVMTGL